MKQLTGILLLLFAHLLSAQTVQEDRLISYHTALPSDSGATFQLFLHEKADSILLDTTVNFDGKVVLMLHGEKMPSQVIFDLQYKNHSWMDYLVAQGLDMFTMDFTGYGNSSRLSGMDDPCNLSPADQNFLNWNGCGNPPYPYLLQYTQFENAELDSVVDFLRNLRNVNRISLVGYGLGGQRALTYASGIGKYKIDKIVTFGTGGAPTIPQYTQPDSLPVTGTALSFGRESQTKTYFNDLPCIIEADIAVDSALWQAQLASDSLGATWGAGVMRYPQAYRWNYSDSTLGQIDRPTLIIRGDKDQKITNAQFTDLYQDLTGTSHKVGLTLRAGGHLMPFEGQHDLLFEHSAAWLTLGNIQGKTFGRATHKIDGLLSWNGEHNDTVKPHIVEMVPANNAFNVPTNTDLTLTYNEYVYIAQQGHHLEIKKASDNSVVQSFNLKISPEVTQECENHIFIDLAPLDPATTYYVDIEQGAVFDDSQNFSRELNGVSKWVFSTTFFTDLDDLEKDKQAWRIYPNPTHGRVRLIPPDHQPKGNCRVGIYGLQGQQIGEWSLTDLKLDLHHLPKGIYLIRIQDETSQSTHKVIIE